MKQMARRWNRTRAGGTRPRTEEPSSHCWDYFARRARSAGRPGIGSRRAGQAPRWELLWSREEATWREIPATCAYWCSGFGFGATDLQGTCTCTIVAIMAIILAEDTCT